MEAYRIGNVSPETKEFYARLKARTLIVLEGIQGKREGYEQEAAAIDEMMIETFKPQKFDGYDGREIQLIKQFEKTCGLLTKHLNIQFPEKLTVRKYYMRLADLKEIFKPQGQNKKHGHRNNSDK